MSAQKDYPGTPERGLRILRDLVTSDEPLTAAPPTFRRRAAMTAGTGSLRVVCRDFGDLAE